MQELLTVLCNRVYVALVPMSRAYEAAGQDHDRHSSVMLSRPTVTVGRYGRTAVIVLMTEASEIMTEHEEHRAEEFSR